MPDTVIDVRHLTKRFGGRAVVDDVSMHGQPRRDRRLPRPERLGQDHDDPHDLRPADASTPARARCSATTSATESRAIKDQVGYMTQTLLALRGPDDRGEPRLRRRPLPPARPARRGRATPSRPLGLDLAPRASSPARSPAAGSSAWRSPPASCTRPQLLLLDEPTAGVDPKARREFWDEIHRLTAGGITVLVSTHYMDEAERCHRISYISYGRLIAEGTVDEVVERAGLHHLRRHRPRPRRRSPAACARRPASTRSPPSAPRCTSSAATARRSKPRSPSVAREPAIAVAPGRDQPRGRLHPVHGRPQDNMA